MNEDKEWKTNQTQRGFSHVTFKDYNKTVCNIQDSSLATDYCMWLGIDTAEPLVMASQAAAVGVSTEKTAGWIPYPVPKQVFINTRMHLTQDDAKRLIKILKRFVKTGSIGG